MNPPDNGVLPLGHAEHPLAVGIDDISHRMKYVCLYVTEKERNIHDVITVLFLRPHTTFSPTLKGGFRRTS